MEMNAFNQIAVQISKQLGKPEDGKYTSFFCEYRFHQTIYKLI